MPTFVDRGVSRGQRGGSPAVINLSFLDRIVLHFLKIKIYKTIILPVAPYGREIRYLVLRDRYRLRVSDNGVLRRIFGSERDDVICDLYSSQSIIRIINSRRMRWAGYGAEDDRA
jgi:hypothetical protein